jgi:DNA-binding XRE family transcriptional regulator
MTPEEVRRGRASTIGWRIKTRRHEITRYRGDQGQLARDVGVSRTSVSAWENDLFKPTWWHLQRLAECLGVSMDWIMEGAPSPVGHVTESSPIGDST